MANFSKFLFLVCSVIGTESFFAEAAQANAAVACVISPKLKLQWLHIVCTTATADTFTAGGDCATLDTTSGACAATGAATSLGGDLTAWGVTKVTKTKGVQTNTPNDTINIFNSCCTTTTVLTEYFQISAPSELLRLIYIINVQPDAAKVTALLAGLKTDGGKAETDFTATAANAKKYYKYPLSEKADFCTLPESGEQAECGCTAPNKTYTICARDGAADFTENAAIKKYVLDAKWTGVTEVGPNPVTTTTTAKTNSATGHMIFVALMLPLVSLMA